MRLERVDREAEDLHVALVELGLDLRHVTELGGADRREILGMGKQHGPIIADPLVKLNFAARRLCCEIRSSVIDSQGHSSPPSRE